MVKVFFALAQRLVELKLLAFETVFFQADSLLDLTGGVFLRLRRFDGEEFGLLLQLRLRHIAGMRCFLQIVRQLGGGFHCGHLRIRNLAAGLDNLVLGVLGDFHQFLVMFLHQGSALRLGGRALGVQLLTHLGDSILPGILAHLDLAVDLRLLKITQGIFLLHHAVEGIRHAGQLGHPFIPGSFCLRDVVVGLLNQLFHVGRFLPLQLPFFFGQCPVANIDFIRRVVGEAYRARHLLAAGTNVKFMQPAAKETQAIFRTFFLWMKNGGETDFHQQRGQERDDESQHRINPDAHHADLVRV